MTPKFAADADGDVAPCGIMWNLEDAKAWDTMKKSKYGGKAKGLKGVETFYQHNPELRPWWYRLAQFLRIHRIQ